MMAQAHPKLALRPFLPVDAPLLREIFRASIEELTGDDYRRRNSRPGPPPPMTKPPSARISAAN